VSETLNNQLSTINRLAQPLLQPAAP